MAEGHLLLGEQELEIQHETKQLCEIKTKSRSVEGYFTRYFLNTSTVIKQEWLKREIFGEKDPGKPQKTILLIGETGTGKSTLINAMVNYILGVKYNDRMWCEILETQTDQTTSQTNAVSVYDVFAENSPFSLTVIDTPGYGSTRGIEEDLKVAETLQKLFRMKAGVQKLDAVGLVVSTTCRLTDRQLYVFDAISSLFGRDVEQNFVVLITNVTDRPINTIKAIKKSKIKCAKTDDGKIVNYCFDNFHCEAFNQEDEYEFGDEEYQEFERKWQRNENNMRDFFTFLKENKPIDLALTESVLKQRKQLTASISNLKERIKIKKLKSTELEQIQKSLKTHEEKKDRTNFECEVDEVYKEKVPFKSEWWQWTKEATCCSVCEENCHYPGCWWVRDLSWCSVMKDGKCTVCTGKCDYTDHVKEGKMYVMMTRKVKRTEKDLKKKFDNESGDIKSLINKLEKEIKHLETQKTRLVEECYQCVIALNVIALTTVSTLRHLDFLIEKVKETGNEEREKILTDLKQSGEEKNKGMLGRIVKYWYS